MSTPQPNDPAYNHVDPGAPVVDPPPRTNPLLWVLLLLGLIVLGWWFYGRQAAESTAVPATDATTSGAVIPADTSPTGNVPARAETAASKKPTDKPKPVARLTRDPVPLAGNEAPRYPAQALRSGVEGSVNVRIELDVKGVPTDVQVVERTGERSRDLDRAVLEAARKWRFEPAMKDGKPVAAAVVLPVDFKRQ